MKKTILTILVLLGAYSSYSQTWSLIGNSGTTPSTNFLGTTDNQPIVFKINSGSAGIIGNSGYVCGIGQNALKVLTNGTYIAALGTFTLWSNTSGSYNTGLGAESLTYNTTGSSNTGIGTLTLFYNTTGSSNTASGIYSMMQNTTGSYNTAQGVYSLRQNTTGGYNTALGERSLYNNSTANFNTAVGDSALVFNTSGLNNIALGSQAGLNVTTGNNNIIIGRSVNVLDGTANNQLFIGNGNKVWLKGTAGAMGIPGSLTIGTDSTGNTYLPTGYSFAVNGKAMATSVVVQLRNGWPDYVFKPNYQLTSLQELKKYVEKNNHLPEMPSEMQIAKEGLNIGDANRILTKQVEELTLYLFEKDKEINQMRVVNQNLENKLTDQENRLKKIEEQLIVIDAAKSN
ncbi:MAG: hypothetical protein JWP45_2751 [Mucilaginibacter sp.]|nr:hypothetical protein [Mucilaginibacter sp.]